LDLLDSPSFNVTHITSMAVAALVWAYCLIFCVGRVKRAGIAFDEPILWLYGVYFRTFRGLMLPIALGMGYLLPARQPIEDYVAAWGLPLGLGLGWSLLVCGLIGVPLRLFLRWRANLRDVIYEPPTPGQVVLRFILAVLALGAVAALPFGAGLALGMDAATLIQSTDPATFLGLTLLYVFFWIMPALAGWRDAELERQSAWAGSTGLQAVRWGLLGLMAFLCLGLGAGIPGLDLVATLPLAPWIALCLAVGGAIAYAVLWILPITQLESRAADEDFLARERLAPARLFGLPAYLGYLMKSRARGQQKQSPDKAAKLCPTCLHVIDDIGAYHKLKFDACPHCGGFIPPLFGVMDYLEYQNRRLAPMIEEGADGAGKSKKRVRREEEARRVQELLHTLISVAVAERGTDLHLSTEGDRFVVRCRTDGVMRTLCSYDQAMERPMISSLKVMASLDITERRRPQDGSFKTEACGRTLDVRVNTSPVPTGEVAAARLLYSQGEIGSLAKLGMSRRNERQLLDAIRRSSGIILVVGPTGSGKSTTLYNCLDAISSGDRNIITLEDPIEYKIDGVSQMQVNETKGFTFATGLRSILRQDPDVIMVGEIRDAETAGMAISAAATGHLVFSTLHSPDSVGAIARLADLGVEQPRFAASTLLTVSQRLVRLNCTECSTEIVLKREELEREGLGGVPREAFDVRKGEGCPHCRDSGFYGREGIYEFFMPDEAMRAMIAERATLPALRTEARARGMRTLLEDGLTKVLMGHTTLEEVLRVAR
jgi:type II secretory ATPase GspE/PulE/Tfp pilus assembly ATPase PilB-like protein